MTKETVYALLKDTKALTAWQEASAEAVSENPTVRGIIDNNLGYVYLARLHPADEVEEHIIRVETDNKEKALRVLPSIPGVQAAKSSVQALTQA